MKEKLLQASVVLFTTFFAFSCMEEANQPQFTPFENPVAFAQPSDGQKTMYVAYTANCGSQLSNFDTIGDTLVLEVAQKHDSLFFKEYFTEFSNNYVRCRCPDTVQYYIQQNEDYLLIKDRSRSALFYFYGNDTIRFNVSDKVALSQNECRLLIEENVFIGEEVGDLNRFRLGSFEVRDRTAVSCVPQILMLEGYLIYNSEELSVSHTVSGELVSGYYRL